MESTISKVRDTIGDNRVLTTSNKGISSGFDNRIAVVVAIVGSITFFNYHRDEGGAITESRNSNARYAVRNGDGGERGATFESITFNARYAIGDGDGGEGGATIECRNSNAGYAIGDGDRGEGGAIIESIISNARNAVGCTVTVVGNSSRDGGGGDR